MIIPLVVVLIQNTLFERQIPRVVNLNVFFPQMLLSLLLAHPTYAVLERSEYSGRVVFEVYKCILVLLLIEWRSFQPMSNATGKKESCLLHCSSKLGNTIDHISYRIDALYVRCLYLFLVSFYLSAMLVCLHANPIEIQPFRISVPAGRKEDSVILLDCTVVLRLGFAVLHSYLSPLSSNLMRQRLLDDIDFPLLL